jgi:hypothetical protein
MASETGVLPFKPEEIMRKGRLQPGKMLLVDLEQGRLVPDKEIKQQLSTRQPFGEWLAENQITLDSLPEPTRMQISDHGTVVSRQRCFGYTDEDLRLLISPMASEGQEAIGSMGIDAPLACLSDRPQSLFHYFKQLFAQVTNPGRRQYPKRGAGKLPHAKDAAPDSDKPRTGKTAARVAR